MRVKLLSDFRNAVIAMLSMLQVENEIFEAIKKDVLVPGSSFTGISDKPTQARSQPPQGTDVNDPIPLLEVKVSHFSAIMPELSSWYFVKCQRLHMTTLGNV